MESLEAEHEVLAARAKVATEGEEKAVANYAEAQARADSVERSSGARVRELENEAAQLRQQLETGANAAQARGKQQRRHFTFACECGACERFGSRSPSCSPPFPFYTDCCCCAFHPLVAYTVCTDVPTKRVQFLKLVTWQYIVYTTPGVV